MLLSPRVFPDHILLDRYLHVPTMAVRAQMSATRSCNCNLSGLSFALKEAWLKLMGSCIQASSQASKFHDINLWCIHCSLGIMAIHVEVTSFAHEASVSPLVCRSPVASSLGLHAQNATVWTPSSTMRFGSTAKVLLKCKLKYYRISGHRAASLQVQDQHDRIV